MFGCRGWLFLSLWMMLWSLGSAHGAEVPRGEARALPAMTEAAVVDLDVKELDVLKLDLKSKADEWQSWLEEVRSKRVKVEKRINIAKLSPSVLAFMKSTRDALIGRLPRWKEQSLHQQRTDLEIQSLELEDRLDARRKAKSSVGDLEVHRLELTAVLDALIEAEFLRERLIKEAQDFIAYVDQRVLWTRSHPPLWSIAPRVLLNDFNMSVKRFMMHWTVPLLSVLSFMLFWVLLLNWILEKSSKVLRVRENSATKLLRLLFLLGLQVSVIGLLFGVWAPRLDVNPVATGWDDAMIFFTWALVIGLTRSTLFAPGGIFLCLYPSAALAAEKLRKASWWWMFFGFAWVFIELLSLKSKSSSNGFSGWCAVGLLMVFGFSYFRWCWRLQKQKDLFVNRRDFERGNLHRLLICCSALAPFVLMIFVFFGYRESASLLANGLLSSIVVVFIWNVSLGLLWWIRRRLGREAREDVRELNAEGEDIDAEDLRSADKGLVSIFRCLGWVILFSGLYWVWADVLLALEFAKKLNLWTLSGGDSFAIYDLFLIIAVIYGSVLIHRNLSDALEVYLFIPMGISQGNRYAISTVIHYIFIFGMAAFIFFRLGFTWSSIQWLAAAFSVGLGFGMQEIFANFVSGLILLFERPVRVGDVISLEGYWGTVQRINIRSTTILNWDRQEIIIPNKELVTGRLTNWTLSDNLVRVIVKVGVAYRSDVEKAKGIMMDLALNHPKVAKEPEPMVAFMEFGDSSLNLEMDIYLKDFQTEDDLDDVRDGINMGILTRFRAEGINIPFPQREVYQYQVPYNPKEHEPESPELRDASPDTP